jgi:hypothetical protein
MTFNTSLPPPVKVAVHKGRGAEGRVELGKPHVERVGARSGEHHKVAANADVSQRGQVVTRAGVERHRAERLHAEPEYRVVGVAGIGREDHVIAAAGADVDVAADERGRRTECRVEVHDVSIRLAQSAIRLDVEVAADHRAHQRDLVGAGAGVDHEVVGAEAVADHRFADEHPVVTLASVDRHGVA